LRTKTTEFNGTFAILATVSKFNKCETYAKKVLVGKLNGKSNQDNIDTGGMKIAFKWTLEI
jgi:hypothetical protein